MKHQIKHRYTDAILFECELPDDTPSGMAVRLSLEKSTVSDANLRDANLCGANLRDANLRGADLCGANLRDADLRGADLRDANLRDANLRDANLRDANLRGANLCDANLRDADLRDADLRGANLYVADLRGANLCVAKNDFWEILLRAPREITGLRAALVAGKVNGSTYKGACACLVGTIANVRGDVDYRDLGNGLKPNSSSPAERWFLGIDTGDTPETNQISAITVEWLDEFVSLLESAKVTA